MKLIRRIFQWLAYFVTASLLVLGIVGMFRDSESDMFMPHSHCFLFNQELIMLHSFSDLAIGLVGQAENQFLCQCQP